MTTAITVSIRIIPISKETIFGEVSCGAGSFGVSGTTYSGELECILGIIGLISHYKFAA